MTRGKGLAMTREVMLLLKIPAKQGIIAEIPGNRRSLYEVQYMPTYSLAFLFLSSSGMPSKMVIDNGMRPAHNGSFVNEAATLCNLKPLAGFRLRYTGC
jgi:hypothetical protein